MNVRENDPTNGPKAPIKKSAKSNGSEYPVGEMTACNQNNQDQANVITKKSIKLSIISTESYDMDNIKNP